MAFNLAMSHGNAQVQQMLGLGGGDTDNDGASIGSYSVAVAESDADEALSSENLSVRIQDGGVEQQGATGGPVPDIGEAEEVLDDWDAVAGAITFGGTSSRGGVPVGSGFGLTATTYPAFTNVSIVRGSGTFTVTADFDMTVRWDTRANNGSNITSDIDANITDANYPQVVADLTPDMGDLGGRPPRSTYWASDLTDRHELFHVDERLRFGREGMQHAVRWLNNQTANSEADVRTLLSRANDRLKSYARAKMTNPGKEARAYADGAPLYLARAQAIQSKGNAGDYPNPALQAFLSHGVFGPQTLRPPTGLGGFDAEYHPSTGDLVVTIQGSIDFIDGLSDVSGVLVANNSDLLQAAADGSAIVDPAARAAFLASFQWDEGVKTNWIATLESNVMETWSNKFTFGVDRGGWACALAVVRLEVDIIGSQCREGDHLAIQTFKCPDDGAYDVGAFVNPGGGVNDNRMVLSSRDMRSSEERTADGESLLQRQIGPFRFDSANTGPLSGDISAFAADFIDANGDLTNPVRAIGRASSDGNAAYNQDLGLRRATAVKTALESLGFANVRTGISSEGETGATADAEWRRVDLIVGDGRAQDVGAHEFGHVLGLTDHYDNAGTDANGDGTPDRGGTITGSGQAAGTVAGHDALARSIGVTGGAVHENNDGLMSLGTNVEASNYATIGWALQTITGIPEWRINQ